MILFTLLSHQWKSFWRSRSTGKSIAIQIFMGLLLVYLLAIAVYGGIYLKELIEKNFPGQDPAQVFCGAILYYFCLDILLRFQMQDLPTLTVQPYLILNIKKSQLIRFLNIRSAFTFLNFLPLILSLPFTIFQIGPEYGGAAMVSFIVTVFFLAAFNHFLILYIKRKTIISSWWLVGFFVVIGVFGACDYFKIFSVSHASSVVFSKFLLHPALCLIPVVMAFAAFLNNYYFLRKSFYLEDAGGKGKRKKGSDYAFLDRFGDIGELIALDIKLMLRNQRPRSILTMSGILLLYGFFFYKPELIAKGMWGSMLIGAIFITGIFITTYGQYLFAWQSAHFDGLMACRLSIRNYIKGKFMLFTAVCTLSLLLSSLYGIMSWKLILLQAAAYFYNIGINAVIAVYFATMSYKAVDISRRAAFNYQGLGAAQWIYSLTVLLIPMMIFLPFKLIGHSSWLGILALGVLGLISLLLQDWWVGVLTKQFVKRKYLILEGFREK